MKKFIIILLSASILALGALVVFLALIGDKPNIIEQSVNLDITKFIR